MKIRELDISARAKSCLLNAGYTDIEDLREVSDELSVISAESMEDTRSS